MYIEQYVQILSDGTYLCIPVNTSSMYIMYVLNVPIYVHASSLSFHFFSISVSLNILMLILNLGEWGLD